MTKPMTTVLTTVCLLMSLSGHAYAADKAAASPSAASPVSEPSKNGSTPHEVVAQVTDELLAVIKSGATLVKENPDKYFSNVEKVLEKAVSFDYIARNVMTKRYWTSATEEQRMLFVKTFKRGMVETLAKGMANYTDLEMSLVPPAGDISGQKRVEVLQEVKASDGMTKVSYTMAQGRSGEWKLINVVLNGVNLGKSFRDQFLQAYKKHSGNINVVTKQWGKEA